MRPDSALLADLAAFARAHVASGDIDPAYPVLRELEGGFAPETALWHTVLYCAFYDLVSAHTIFLSYASEPTELRLDVARMPTGIERRGLRGGTNMNKHLRSIVTLIDSFGSFQGWLGRGVLDGRDPAASTNMERRFNSWRLVSESAGWAWGNGRWATYKTAELLEKVHGWPLSAPDMGNEGSSGPLAGLRLLFPGEDLDSPATNGTMLSGRMTGLTRADEASIDLKVLLAIDHGVTLTWEQLETVLCDFHALVDGRYYVGHDIDVMLAQLSRPGVPSEISNRILKARSKAFPAEYRGELEGRTGVDSDRKKVYRDTGVILTR